MLTWAMMIVLSSSGQDCIGGVPYGSFERCQHELPAAIHNLGAGAKGECMLVPMQVLLRPACFPAKESRR